MQFVGPQYDNRYTSLVGWEQTAMNAGAGYKYFFSKENMDYISAEVSRQLKTFGLQVRVAPEVIGGVMSDIIRAQNPKIGDIWTRYNIPQGVSELGVHPDESCDEGRNDAKSMTIQVINVLLNQILGEQQQACCNSKLSIWSTLKGDFNTWGLRTYSTIQAIKRNDHIKGVFMMNY